MSNYLVFDDGDEMDLGPPQYAYNKTLSLGHDHDESFQHLAEFEDMMINDYELQLDEIDF